MHGVELSAGVLKVPVQLQTQWLPPQNCQLGVCWGLAVRTQLPLRGDGWEGVFQFGLVN